MGVASETCWTLIRAAASGDEAARDLFGRTYLPLVKAYLGARWSGSPLAAEVDDAAQDVFVDFLKGGGALERAEMDRPGGFRAFLFGVVRTQALRVEARRARPADAKRDDAIDLDAQPADETSLSRVLDREWARALMREAGRLHEDRARAAGADAVRRVELLRLRFQHGLEIREIAERWGAEAATLHTQYARAREEFLAALKVVVERHHPGTPAEVERQCRSLLALLG